MTIFYKTCFTFWGLPFREMPRRQPTWDLWTGYKWVPHTHTCADNVFISRLKSCCRGDDEVFYVWYFWFQMFHCPILDRSISKILHWESINIQSSSLSLPIVFPIKASTLTKHFLFLDKSISILCSNLCSNVLWNVGCQELWLCKNHKIFYYLKN